MPKQDQLQGQKKILFPLCTAAEEVKVDRFLGNISEFMDVDLTIQKIKIIEVTVPEDRLDVAVVINRVIMNEKKKKDGLISEETKKKKEKDKEIERN